MTCAVAMLALVLTPMAYRLAVTGGWRRIAPTFVLLTLDNDAAWHNFRELARRYQGGELSRSQVQRFFDRTLEPRANFKLLDPYPAGVPVRITLDVTYAEFGIARQMSPVSLPCVWINDGLVDAFEAPSSSGTRLPPQRIQSLRRTALLPALPPGRHVIEVSQNFIYLPPGAAATLPAPPPWTLRVSQIVTVAAIPPEQFVRVQPEMEPEAVCGSIQLIFGPAAEDGGKTGASPSRPVWLHFRNAAGPVVGNLEIRAGANEAFHRVGPVVFEASGANVLNVEVGAAFAHAARIDVRIVPGPAELAIVSGVREYVPNGVKWRDVPVRDLAEAETGPDFAPAIAYLAGLEESDARTYGLENTNLAFEGTFAVLPPKLEAKLREEFPRRKFILARMRAVLGWSPVEFKLLLIAEAGTGKLLARVPRVWIAELPIDFATAFGEFSPENAADLQEKVASLASVLAFAMDGTCGVPALDQSGRTMGVDLFWPRWSTSKPYRRLLVQFDETLAVTGVSLERPTLEP